MYGHGFKLFLLFSLIETLSSSKLFYLWLSDVSCFRRVLLYGLFYANWYFTFLIREVTKGCV